MCEKRLCGRGPRIQSFLQLEHKSLFSVSHLSRWRLLPLVRDLRGWSVPACLSSACELLSVTFVTAVGGTVQDKFPSQLSLLTYFENYPCEDLPTGLLKGEGKATKENDGNPSCKCSPTHYEIKARSPWEFEISCVNLFISLLQGNTKPQRNTKKENDIEHKMILVLGSSPHTFKKSHFYCYAPVITVNECFLSPDGWLVLTACCFSLAE